MHFLSPIRLLWLASTAAAFLLPAPSGRYNVTLTTGPLADSSRIDPSTGEPRTLMLSVFQPADCPSLVPVRHMPKKTAAYQGPFLETIFNVTHNFSPLFQEARLPVCEDSCAPIEDVPILLFSPGYSIPRLYYSSIVSAIASEGFTIITIDHPDDANIITYPDGSAVYLNETAQTNAVFRAHIPARLADSAFVLDQLSNATAMSQLIPGRGPRPFPTDRVAMFGHSLGGVTAVLLAAQDPRIKAASNWDGTFVTKPGDAGVSKPTLLLSHGFADKSWNATWPLLKGPKLWVNIANTTHETFSDVPTILEAAGQDATPFDALLGTIKPAEMRRILVAYTSTWMKKAFEGKIGGALLEGEGSWRFPEVQVVRRGGFEICLIQERLAR